MDYAVIQPIVARWADRHDLKLFTEWTGGPAFFCYTSSTDECFQISVAKPLDNKVTVHAWSIDTRDDAELHEEWTSLVTDIDISLSAALRKIEEWKQR